MYYTNISKYLKPLLYFKGIRGQLAKNELKKNSMFTSIEIETCSYCNRKCSYCPNSNTERLQGTMNTVTFNKIIDDLKSINYSGRVSYHFYNEPLLDPRIIEFVEHTRKELPNVSIILFTNGDKLTFSMINSLIEAGVNKIRISIHDDNFRSFLKVKTFRTYNYKKFVQEVNYYKNLHGMFNRGGLIDIEHIDKKPWCNYVNNTMVITWEGNVVLCCNDYKSENIQGNIKEKSIQNIWWDIHNRDTRARIANGLFDMDICKKCKGIK